MDIVLVGLPGSGKSVVGRRLAQRHGATFIDLDERIESRAGRTIPEIFADDGEDAFRRLERAAVTDLGPADPDPAIHRIVATGGGAIVDPRNRWALYRDRTVIWLDGRPEVLAQRLRRSPRVRPLIESRDPIGAIRDLASKRARFYAAADIRVTGVAEIPDVIRVVEDRLADDRSGRGTTLLRTDTAIGRVVLGDGIAATEVGDTLTELKARRAILVSEPGAWDAFGLGIATALRVAGWTVETILLPQGEDAKRLSVVEGAARDLVRLRVERSEPLVAIGGGALGDAAGFLAATYLRGVPLIHVPTTLVAQIDSSIGGKTGVDSARRQEPRRGLLPAGRHHRRCRRADDPARTTPASGPRRGGQDGRVGRCAPVRPPGVGRGRRWPTGEGSVATAGAVAEIVERCAWAKVEVVLADERERDPSGGRITAEPRSLGRARGRGDRRLQRPAPRGGGRVRPSRGLRDRDASSA